MDQFVGGGTTAVEAKLTHRNFVCIDINPSAIELTKRKCDFDFNTQATIALKVGDARTLPLDDKSIDLICTHPPYADIIHYSENIDGDLSLLPVKEFLFEIGKVAEMLSCIEKE